VSTMKSENRCPECNEQFIIIDEIGVFGENLGPVYYCDLCDRTYSINENLEN